MHEDTDLSAAIQIAQHGITMEVQTVRLLAQFHHLQKEMFGNDIGLQRSHSGSADSMVKNQFLGKSIGTGHEMRAGGRRCYTGADGGDIRPGAQVLLDSSFQIDIGSQVAVHQNHMALGNVMDVSGNRIQCLDGAQIVSGVILGKTEGREHAQSAVAAAHIPVFAASQMIQQGLVVLLHDHTDIIDTGIGKRG